MNTTSSKNDLYLVILVAIPFILRSLLDFFLKSAKNKFWKYTCGGNPIREALLPKLKYHLEESILSDGRKVLILKTDAEDSPSILSLKNSINEQIMNISSFSRTEIINEPADLCSFINLYRVNVSWEYVRLCMGWTPQMAVVVACLRLLFWHWLQPVMYCWVLYSFSSDISTLQLGFGLAVAVREILYFLFVGLGVVVRPHFLLVNMSAGWRSKGISLTKRLLGLAVYIFCPEKGVASFLIDNAFRERSSSVYYYFSSVMTLLLTLVIPLLDFCGMAALIIGAVKDELPYPLAVGYGVTTIAGVTTIVFAIVVIRSRDRGDFD